MCIYPGKFTSYFKDYVDSLNVYYTRKSQISVRSFFSLLLLLHVCSLLSGHWPIHDQFYWGNIIDIKFHKGFLYQYRPYMIKNFVQCGKIDNKIDRVWGPLQTANSHSKKKIHNLQLDECDTLQLHLGDDSVLIKFICFTNGHYL